MNDSMKKNIWHSLGAT